MGTPIDVALRWIHDGRNFYEYLVGSNGYLFDPTKGHTVTAVRGLLGLVTTYVGSPVEKSVDKVVCRVCWDKWLATPPWNDTPPTLKMPPHCSHLDGTENKNGS